MAIIPGRIYRRVEAALHRRDTAAALALARIREAEARATGATAQMDGERVQTSSTGDRLERSVIALAEARDAYADALSWEHVFRRADRYFEGRDEGRCAELFYRRHKSQQQVAGEMYVDRQTVRRWRDNYVVFCALVAAEYGLITMGGQDD